MYCVLYEIGTEVCNCYVDEHYAAECYVLYDLQLDAVRK
jgi:hypothetical protein